MQDSFAHLSMEEIARQDIACACGQRHRTDIRAIIVESGALRRLPQVLAKQRRVDGGPWDFARDQILLVEDEALIGMGTALNPAITDRLTFVLYAVAPFNLVKGVAVSLVTLVL